MIPTFTRGKWEVGINGGDYYVAAKDYPIGDICVVTRDFGVEAQKANATIISVVPQMYWALKELVNLLDAEDPVEVGCYCTEETPCGWCQAKSALRKVEVKGV